MEFLVCSWNNNNQKIIWKHDMSIDRKNTHNCMLIASIHLWLINFITISLPFRYSIRSNFGHFVSGQIMSILWYVSPMWPRTRSRFICKIMIRIIYNDIVSIYFFQSFFFCYTKRNWLRAHIWTNIITINMLFTFWLWVFFFILCVENGNIACFHIHTRLIVAECVLYCFGRYGSHVYQE